MRMVLFSLMFLLLVGVVSAADCIDAFDGMRITNDTTFCSDTYDIPNGIFVKADNITIDCGTAVLRGDSQEGTGIIIEGRKNIVITKCNMLTFHVGIYIKNSTNVLLEDNAMLKNRIGIRMLNAYENTIIKHADKSTQTPLSMITSKFNKFDMNKPIDEEYCISNLCNEEKDINPCVNDDFYCSAKCNEESDNDCIKHEIIKYEKPKEENKTEKPVVKPEPQPEKMTITPKKKGKGWLLYPVFYIFAFLLIQFYDHVRKD